jgi:predicted nuclease of restriction endonuclease-like (RecB) superfamily
MTWKEVTIMLINNSEYFEIVESIKQRIKEAQYRAVLGVNQEQIILFWNIGKTISANVKYGNKFVENLARDIKSDFPTAKGYSVRNLNYMKKFAEIITDEQILQSVAAKLSWTHNIRTT